MSRVIRKAVFCICQNIGAAAHQRLCFRHILVLSLFFLNPKFKAFTHLLWLYSPVCIRPGWKLLRQVFSRPGSYDKISFHLQLFATSLFQKQISLQSCGQIFAEMLLRGYLINSRSCKKSALWTSLKAWHEELPLCEPFKRAYHFAPSVWVGKACLGHRKPLIEILKYNRTNRTLYIYHAFRGCLLYECGATHPAIEKSRASHERINTET